MTVISLDSDSELITDISHQRSFFVVYKPYDHSLPVLSNKPFLRSCLEIYFLCTVSYTMLPKVLGQLPSHAHEM